MKNAINADATLTSLGVTATSASSVISIASTSTNLTFYTTSISNGATELLTLQATKNPVQLAIVGGTKTTGDVLTINFYDSSLPSGTQAISRTVLSGDTLTSIATALSTSINANSNLQAIGVSASASGRIVTIQSNSPNPTTLRQSYSNGSTESILITEPHYGWQVATISGSKTTGDTITLTAFNSDLAGGKESVQHVVLVGDSLASITTALATAINANANLQAIGVSANASSTALSLQSLSGHVTTYSQSTSSGATEIVNLSPSHGITQAAFNSVNELVSTSAGGALPFEGTTSKPVKSANVSTQVINLRAKPPASVSEFNASSSRTPSETTTLATYDGYAGGPTWSATIGGSATVGDKLSLVFDDVRLKNPVTLSYIVKSGDNTSTIALALYNLIYNNVDLSNVAIYPTGLASNQLWFSTATAANKAINNMSVTSEIFSPGTEVLATSTAPDENTNVTISGTMTVGDVVSLTVENENLADGEETVSYTVASGNTATNVATGLKNAVNASTTLQQAGILAESSANVLSLITFPSYTTTVSGGATETLTVGNTQRGNAGVIVGGSKTTGDVVSVVVHSAALTGGTKTISHTVGSSDTLLSISEALSTTINADSDLIALGVIAQNSATLPITQNFAGNAMLPSGASSAAVTAVDGGNNTQSNGYQLSVNGGSSSTLSYDKNGNLLSDGTNTFAWDAENRMIKIVYPGSMNFSDFVYDPLSRNVKIVETTAGSVTSTKQFVQAGSRRCESRDLSGAITAQYFTYGIQIGVSSYYYGLDALGSIHEITDSGGTALTVYAYDPFGSQLRVFESVVSDLGFAGYYLHQRSGLDMTWFREYSPVLSRWLSRDRLGERAGNNLFIYVGNSPINNTDAFGLSGTVSVCAVPVGYPSPGSSFPAGGSGHCWIKWEPDPTENPDPAKRVAGGTYGKWGNLFGTSGLLHDQEAKEGLTGPCTSKHVDDAGEGAIAGDINNPGGWSPNSHCCTWARGAWAHATGEDIGGGYMDPTSIYNAINERNALPVNRTK